jgi:tRNA pseudouridine55 synthase
MTNGILLLDKPAGMSSNAAVQRVRRAFGREKAGHTGSLDPLATGVLPICLGEATKVAGYLLDGDKEYEFTARFGERTSTGDTEGEVVERAAVPDDLHAALIDAIPRYLGTIQQVPPMYSALKRDGVPLYRLARQGLEVERAARPVTIHELTLRAVDGANGSFHVRCSKGTYVRTLAEDLAQSMGSCAHLIALRRTAAEPFPQGNLVTLEQVEAGPSSSLPLLPPDAALPQLPKVTLDGAQSSRLRQGQPVRPDAGELRVGLVRLYDPRGRFLGIGELEGEGTLVKPVRLFNDLGPSAT